MAYYANPYFLRPANQGGAKIQKFKEASSQSFKEGQLVYLVTNGDGLTACASGDNVILGIANQDASGTTGTLISVTVLRPGDEIAIPVYTGSTIDAADSADLYVNFALNVSSNSCTIDLNTTNDDALTVTEVLGDGDWVAAHVLASCLQDNIGI